MTAAKRPELPGWPRLLTLRDGRCLHRALDQAVRGRSAGGPVAEAAAKRFLGVRRITRVWDRTEIDAVRLTEPIVAHQPAPHATLLKR